MTYYVKLNGTVRPFSSYSTALDWARVLIENDRENAGKVVIDTVTVTASEMESMAITENEIGPVPDEEEI